MVIITTEDHLERLGECFRFECAFWDGPEPFDGLNLYQIGEVCGECGYVGEKHLQKCCEISYVVHGTGQTVVDDEVIPLKACDVLMCCPGHIHTMMANSFNTMRFLYLGFTFTEKARQKWGDMVDFYETRPWFVCSNARNILPLFLSCLDEFFDKRLHKMRMVEAYLETILISVYRESIPRNKSYLDSSPSNSSVGSVVYTIIRYVDKHIFDIESVANIAEKLGYSNSYISHIFKQRTGMTLQKYILIKKHEKALDLLRHDGLTVMEVSQRLHYKTIQAFSKSFAHTMGFPPSQYAKAGGKAQQGGPGKA